MKDNNIFRNKVGRLHNKTFRAKLSNEDRDLGKYTLVIPSGQYTYCLDGIIDTVKRKNLDELKQSPFIGISGIYQPIQFSMISTEMNTGEFDLQLDIDNLSELRELAFAIQSEVHHE